MSAPRCKYRSRHCGSTFVKCQRCESVFCDKCAKAVTHNGICADCRMAVRPRVKELPEIELPTYDEKRIKT